MAETSEEAMPGQSASERKAASSPNAYDEGGVGGREPMNDDRDPYASSTTPNFKMAELLASRGASRRPPASSSHKSDASRTSKRDEEEEARVQKNPKIDPSKEKTSWNVVFICAPYAPDVSATRYLPEVISVAPTVVIYDQQEIEIDNVLPLVRDVDAIMPWLSVIEWPPASSKLSDVLHQYLPPGCGITQSAVTLALCGKNKCDVSGTVQGYVNISFGEYHYFIPRHLLRSELAAYPYRRITANLSNSLARDSNAHDNGRTRRSAAASGRHGHDGASAARSTSHRKPNSRANGHVDTDDDAVRTPVSQDKRYYRKVPTGNSSGTNRHRSHRNDGGGVARDGDSFFDDGHDIGADFIKDDGLAEPDLDEPTHPSSRSTHSKRSHSRDPQRKSGYHR